MPAALLHHGPLESFRARLLSVQANPVRSNRFGSGVGRFRQGGQEYEIPILRFSGPPAEHAPIRLGLFAGLHGDEPAGCLALVDFFNMLGVEPEWAKGYDLSIYPLCNPTGFESATRVNGNGKDLNREFWSGSTEPEVRILEEQLTAGDFQGIITLHEDDTAEGVYGYAHGKVLNEALLAPALAAAEEFLPRDPRDRIDGFAAKDGVLVDCFEGVLRAPREQRTQPFDLIIETPTQAELDIRVRASIAALRSVLIGYRSFIAYGEYL